MAAVVQLARTVMPTVSLYVNDYNLPARATPPGWASHGLASSRRSTFEDSYRMAGSARDLAVGHGVWLHRQRASRTYAGTAPAP